MFYIKNPFLKLKKLMNNDNNSQTNFNNKPFLSASNPFQLFNNNAIKSNSNNFLDYLSRIISNNILHAFINNNQNKRNLHNQ